MTENNVTKIKKEIGMDIKKIKEIAEKETKEENEKAAVGIVKRKMKELAIAQEAVRNIQREIQDIYAVLKQ